MKRKSLCVEGNIGADDILQMCLKTKNWQLHLLTCGEKRILCYASSTTHLQLFFFFRVLHWQ